MDRYRKGYTPTSDESANERNTISEYGRSGSIKVEQAASRLGYSAERPSTIGWVRWKAIKNFIRLKGVQ